MQQIAACRKRTDPGVRQSQCKAASPAPIRRTRKPGRRRSTSIGRRFGAECSRRHLYTYSIAWRTPVVKIVFQSPLQTFHIYIICTRFPGVFITFAPASPRFVPAVLRRMLCAECPSAPCREPVLKPPQKLSAPPTENAPWRGNLSQNTPADEKLFPPPCRRKTPRGEEISLKTLLPKNSSRPPADEKRPVAREPLSTPADGKRPVARKSLSKHSCRRKTPCGEAPTGKEHEGAVSCVECSASCRERSHGAFC